MFCSKCGKKLVKGYTTCRNCGEPVETAEYCGGFWGLVSEHSDAAAGNPAVRQHAPEQAAAPDGRNTAGDEREKGDSERRKSKAAGKHRRRRNGKVLPIVLLIACVLLLGGLIGQSIRVNSLRANAEKAEFSRIQLQAGMIGQVLQASEEYLQQEEKEDTDTASDRAFGNEENGVPKPEAAGEDISAASEENTSDGTNPEVTADSRSTDTNGTDTDGTSVTDDPGTESDNPGNHGNGIR